MYLTEIFTASSKAQLQGYYLHWFPGKEMISARERLQSELGEVMKDHVKARQRFDALGKAPQSFLTALLLQEEYSGTVDAVRASKYGRGIADFEVEGCIKSLMEAGYIVKASGTGGYAHEVFAIARELADALSSTIVLEERPPLSLLSLCSARGADALEAAGKLPPLLERIEALTDATLRKLARAAVEDHGGILTRSEALTRKLAPEEGSLDFSRRRDWRDALEGAGVGTCGVLTLKDYGIDLEEDGLYVYQELVADHHLAVAASGVRNDKEVILGADLIIDLDRALEILRTEKLEVTREGNVYKKCEDRLLAQFVTSQHPEFHDGSVVTQVFELCKKLRFYEDEGSHMALDPLRRRVWRKKPFDDKVRQVYDIFRSEKRGQRWSFHQAIFREMLLESLRTASPGSWLVARPFLTAIIARYLARLGENKVAESFKELCSGDFKNETLVVPLSKLYHDLSFWLLHRLVLLGLVDVGYKDGVFSSICVSRLGLDVLGVPSGADTKERSPDETAAAASGPLVLVNPDFEVLVYPDEPEASSWRLSLFADRVDSERVKRYKLTRESIKRGIVAGLTSEDMIHFLEERTSGRLPPNVKFSLREWTDGVELVRLQKVHLLRPGTSVGADRVAAVLEEKSISYERLNDTTVMVRGTKNERAVRELLPHFRQLGLFVE